MGTISKINFGGVDYDIVQGGLGSKIGKSTNLNDLRTPDTMYYFDGNEDDVPSNSPSVVAYRLTVRNHPNGAVGSVIQRADGEGFAVERVGFQSGASYSWGDWGFVNCYDSGWSNAIGTENMKYRVVGGVATVVVIDHSGEDSVGTLPIECRPDTEMHFAATWAKADGSSVTYGTCCLVVFDNGTVHVLGMPSGARLVDSTFTFVIGNGYGNA